ncbi:synaptosomal-associated protein 47 [Hoplias malabaricus]|uniref:synaptosomal-associated protein 47 n=1 Tax=Hoplias malabaricus TaxID=27720 RepID=UPI0034619C5F
MSRESSIHSWPGSYYVNSEKRWVNGELSLSRTTLRFTSQTQETLASFPLSHISQIKMESSSFIFSALTLLEQGGVKHWFGSLRPCRAAVFHVLEHFWRETLLSPSSETQAPLSKGQELISLVSGAQRRLADTGKVLNHQGEQFDNMMQGLDKMESELSVADKLLSELESPPWWPFGKLPWRSQQEEKAESGAKAPPPRGGGKVEKAICSIPAVVWRGGEPAGERRPGSLTLLASALELRDASERMIHRFERDEVDEVRVHSPYELSVRQRFIGKPDICFRLLSARMSQALSILQLQYRKKVEFTSDYISFHQGAHRISPSTAECSADIWSTGAHGADTEVPVAVPVGELTQVQLHVLQPTVTDAEAQELKQMLLQLKSLALEAETELERQDEALDVLASSSERATMSIDKHTRRMRKLL